MWITLIIILSALGGFLLAFVVLGLFDARRKQEAARFERIASRTLQPETYLRRQFWG